MYVVRRTYILYFFMYNFRAEAVFETVKQTFGANNCFMLPINSKSNIDPNLSNDFWAQYITRAPDINVSIIQYCKTQVILE